MSQRGRNGTCKLQSYQNMGEHNLYEWRSRKVDRQGWQRLHFQRNQTACYMDFVILVISCFINPKRDKKGRIGLDNLKKKLKQKARQTYKRKRRKEMADIQWGEIYLIPCRSQVFVSLLTYEEMKHLQFYSSFNLMEKARIYTKI